MTMDRIWMRGTAGLLACGLVQACAPAPLLPPQVCGDVGVMRQVDEMIRARGRTMVLDAPTVGEVSTNARASPPLAYCSVRGHTVGYDTNRYGASPVYEPFIVSYTVEMRRNGVFVRLD